MKITKKMFRELLNEQFGFKNWKHNRYQNTKRPYGDYLYAQDRDMFNVNFAEWKSNIESGKENLDARWTK